jgi:hypothetical protein
MRPSSGWLLAVGAGAVVVVAIAVGLFVLGSPSDERARRTDDRRVSDLQGIKAAVDLYWTRHSVVPASMTDLTAEPGVRIGVSDPVSSDPYGYQALDTLSYEVCATFEAESDEIAREETRDLWAHGSGAQCFRLEAEDIVRDEG